MLPSTINENLLGCIIRRLIFVFIDSSFWRKNGDIDSLNVKINVFLSHYEHYVTSPLKLSFILKNLDHLMKISR